MIKDNMLGRARLMMYQARVSFSVRRQNLEVTQAFNFHGESPSFKKVAVFAGTGIVAFSVISWAVTGPMGSVAVGKYSNPGVAQDSALTTSALSPTLPTPEEVEAIALNIPDLAALPLPDFDIPAQETSAIYTLAVDKTNHALYVLEETQDNYRIVEQYPISIGAERGDKQVTGDKRTPEGIYQIVGIKEDAELLSEYGPRAFVLNYPNDVDMKQGKSGYGIWIHGSGMGDKTKPTKGCVQVNDFHIMELGRFAEKGTQVYIFPEGYNVPVANRAIQKNVLKPLTLYGIKKFRDMKVAERDQKLASGESAGSRRTGG
ncbi:MAG: L,D-transpeptidase family protein [Nitrospinae bacterium]|nr:L,D-transpeptidase family protein [Nitrospinota bacterium]